MKDLFLDMDGVLVDLVGRIRCIYGFHGRWLKGCYDIKQVIPKLNWNDFKNNAGVWRHLWKTEYCDTILNSIDTEKYDVHIFSSPLDAACAKGKMDWLEENIFPMIKITSIILTPFKKSFGLRLVNSASVVIDDDPAIAATLGKKCPVLLVPQPWNSEPTYRWERKLRKVLKGKY